MKMFDKIFSLFQEDKTIFDHIIDDDLKAVKKLVEQDENNLNDRNMLQSTPLMTALRNGHINIVRYLLLKKETDIYLTDKDGLTALDHALIGFGSDKGKQSPEICLMNIKLLLDHEVALRRENKIPREHCLLKVMQGKYSPPTIDSIRYHKNAKPYESRIRALIDQQEDDLRNLPPPPKDELIGSPEKKTLAISTNGLRRRTTGKTLKTEDPEIDSKSPKKARQDSPLKEATTWHNNTKIKNIPPERQPLLGTHFGQGS